MTGGAAGAVGDGRVIVTLVIKMTAQAAAAQEIVGKGEGVLGGIGFGDLDHRLQISRSTEGAANQVDEIFQGKMRCGAETVDLMGMAWTAGPGHRLRVGRLGDQAAVGRALFFDGIIPLMTGGAVHGVVAVQHDGMTAGAAVGAKRA